MPTFIPPYMGEEIKSNAEKKMYDILQQLNMKNAYVLHSLGLPKHQSKIYGEIDFVVVCERGIACLEIKGGRVECRDGKWLFTDRYGVEREKPEGPFAQVTGNMFSLKQILAQRFANIPQMKNVLVACGVVFPDIEFKSRAQEIIPEIIFDKSTEDITEYMNRMFDYWESRQHREVSKLPPGVIQELVGYLRGEFSFIPSLADRLDGIEKRLVRLTMEQAQVMEALGMNEHLLVEGNAGTGKTLLAVDFAIKQSKQGKKVLYLTFNKNLSNNILSQIESNENLKVINIHALFGEYVVVNVEKMKENPRDYFAEVLPDEFYEFVSNLSEEQLKALQYDLLVMDEGQDIIKPNYLYSLDYLLKDGFEKGRWAVFYDEKQNIYNPAYQDGMELLQSYPCAKFKLFVNCRNTVQIGTYSAKESGFSLTEFLKENGEEVQKVTYVSWEDYGKQIKDILKKLRAEKVAMKDITFLAPKKYKNSRLYEAGIEVMELGVDEAKEDVPCFATIQGYKGLDAKIVILCDVDDIHDKNYSRFIYIAATRARTLLYIVGSEEFWQHHT